MAIKLTNKYWCPFTEDYRCEFIMDSAADAAALPQCCVGSTALVADNSGTLYMVNASGEWKEM